MAFQFNSYVMRNINKKATKERENATLEENHATWKMWEKDLS